jgi:ankyrin repeat protein
MKPLIKTLCIFAITSITMYANQNQILIKSATIGDIDWVKLSLLYGADVNTKGGIYKQTPLLLSVLDGNTQLAKYLLENNADINATSVTNRGVMNYALYHKDDELLRLLIDKGANVQSINKDGENLLFEAVKRDKIEFAKELLKTKKLDINLANIYGTTPLLLALHYNEPEMAKLLIENGASLASEDKNGNSVLSYAIKYRDNELFFKALGVANLQTKVNYEIFDSSYKKLPKEVSNKQRDFSLLHLAARYGTKEMIEALLKTSQRATSNKRSGKQFDIEETTTEFFKYSPLAIAASYKNYDTFMALVDNGANLYKKFQSINQHSMGLGYWLGGGDAYTPLGLSIAGEGESIDTRIVDFILTHKDFKKMVSLEDENFYLNFSILARSDSKSIYAKVLQALDDNGFVKSSSLITKLDEIKKEMGKEESSNEKEKFKKNDELYRLISNCEKDDTKIIPFIKANKIDLKKIHKRSNYMRLPILIETVGDCSSELSLNLIKAGADVDEMLKNENLLDRIFTSGVEKKDYKLIEYLLKNTNQAKKTFKDESSFHSFLFSGYDEVWLFDEFIKAGTKPPKDATLKEYMKRSKSQELAFKIFDLYKDELKKIGIEELAMFILEANDPDKDNIEHLMKYATLHQIPFDPTAIMFSAIYQNEIEVANKALLLGANKDFEYDGVDSCKMLQARYGSDKNAVEFFCQNKPKTLGYYFSTNKDKKEILRLVKAKDELFYQVRYLKEFLNDFDFKEDEAISIEIFDAFLENIDPTSKYAQEVLESALSKSDEYKFDYVISKLIYKGIEPNTLVSYKDRYITPLIWAIKYNKLEEFLYLLNHKADPNYTNYRARNLASPLRHALHYDREVMFQKLLEFGAKPEGIEFVKSKGGK